jgi:hypothetical protein
MLRGHPACIPGSIPELGRVRRAHGSPGHRQDGRSCRAPRSAKRAAPKRVMGTVMRLAKPIEVADNPRRLNVIVKSAPELHSAQFRYRRARASNSTRRGASRASNRSDASPSVTALRPLRHGSARRSRDVYRTSVTARPERLASPTAPFRYTQRDNGTGAAPWANK